jgi:NADPH-dependent curcumin reductase CurA
LIVLTARRCLDILDILDLTPGATLVVTWAAQAFGGYIVEITKVAGLQVIADRSLQHNVLLPALRDDGAITTVRE